MDLVRKRKYKRHGWLGARMEESSQEKEGRSGLGRECGKRQIKLRAISMVVCKPITVEAS